MRPQDLDPPETSAEGDEPVYAAAQTVAKLVNAAPPPEILGDTASLGLDGGGSITPRSIGADEQTTTIFRLEQIVAGRYRIVRFLAQGGMGEVYEALDLELSEPVALKIIRPEIARDERILARFNHEIRLARKVTHPNVCRIFDLSRHRIEAGDEVTFLTMELLQGETLSARLRREGRMSCAEALPLVRQMAEALHAAHEAGVVHLDFKSQNVMLVESEKSLRAIVMDFGLARHTADEGRPQKLVEGGLFLGTPATMAPEQVESAQVTAAADIYAFGMVLYQMVTGSLPFTGKTPMTTAIRRLREPPPSPKLHAPDLDPRWEAAILRCLKRDPAERFGRVTDVVEALCESPLSGAVSAAPRPAPRKRRRLLALASVSALLLMASAAGYRLYATSILQDRSMQGNASFRSTSQARRSVAILGFKNLSERPDKDWISTALSEMFGIELAAGGRLRVVPGEDVARMRLELALSRTDGFSRDTLEQIRRNLGTDLVVLGSYLALEESAEGRIRLSLLVQDTTNGESVASFTASGSEAELHELIARTGAQLREALQGGQLSADAAREVRSSFPRNPEAARLFAEGIEKLRGFEALEARDLLERAVAADSRHALSHWALAEAWKRLGHDGKAKEEAHKAFELAQGLSREERLLIEGGYRETTLEWNRAIDIYRSLLMFFPDNLEYGLQLAAAQIAADRATEALNTIEALRKAVPQAPEDPRVDLVEARAAEALADLRRQKAAAERAAQKGAARRARLLVAEARLEAWWALVHLGEVQAAKAACEEAKQICVGARDRACVAKALSGLGYVLWWKEGKAAEARQLQEESLAISREIGDQKGIAEALLWIAKMHLSQGDLVRARERFDEALAISRAVGDQRTVAYCLDNIAFLLQRKGELERSRTTFEEALAIYRTVGQKLGIQSALRGIMTAQLLRGEIRGARENLEELIRIGREVGNRRGLADGLKVLAEVLVLQGQPAQATEVCDEALALFKESGDRLGELKTRIALATALLAQGEPRAARDQLEQALAESRKAEDPTLTAEILDHLGSVLLLEDDRDGARRQHEEALGLIEGQDSVLSLAESRLALVRALIEQAQAAEAELPARSAAEAFRQAGWVPREAEALALYAQALLELGRTAEAREAAEAGVVLMARSENLDAKLAVMRAAARARAASGSPADRAEAVLRLEAALAEAEAAGLVPEVLETRLALGELELLSGKEEPGRARLAALAQEASAKGFGLIARKAASYSGR
jgi:serine/threonine protein kinase/tetratricopeptide (TPR) repeat protein